MRHMWYAIRTTLNTFPALMWNCTELRCLEMLFIVQHIGWRSSYSDKTNIANFISKTMALLHDTFSFSMQNIKICSWNYFNQIWCFKSSIIVNNMTYHLVLSGAFLLPKSIIGSKRQFQNHKRIVQLHRSTVKWKRGPDAVVSGAWPPCWRAVAAVSSALVQEHHTISAGLARRVLMLPTGADTAKSPGTHTHTPPNNTNSDIQKGMQIHRAEMIWSTVVIIQLSPI